MKSYFPESGTRISIRTKYQIIPDFQSLREVKSKPTLSSDDTFYYAQASENILELEASLAF